MKRKVWILALILAGLGSNAQTQLDYAVNFSVTDVDGQAHVLFDYLNEGYFVLIDFFFTDCNPCIGSIPSLNEVYETFGCNQGEVIFLSIDYNDNDSAVIAYKDTFGSLSPSISGLDGGGNSVVESYGISAFPTVILIAPDKEIINQDIYPVTVQNLSTALKNQAGVQADPALCFTTGTVHAETTPAIIHHAALSAGQLYISFSPLQSQSSIRLFDLQGRSLFQYQLQHPVTRSRLEFSFPVLYPLSAGVYLVQVDSPAAIPLYRKVFYAGSNF